MGMPEAQLSPHYMDLLLRALPTNRGVFDVVQVVTVEIGAVACQARTWKGAERAARNVAKDYAKSERYLHALVADMIADEYEDKRAAL